MSDFPSISVSPSTLPPLFNLHGIINLDKLSELFSQLIDHVNRQNDKIQSLETQLQNCLKIPDFIKELGKVETFLQKLEETTNKLDVQSTCMINHKRYGSGEIAQSNFHQIQAIEKKLKNCITKEEYEIHSQQIQSIIDKQEKLNSEIQHLFEIVTLLQNQTLEHSNTLSLQEAMINNKLDKSELPRLQALMKLILVYEDFKNNTIDHLQSLEAFKQQSSQQIHTLEETDKLFQERMASMERELSKFAYRKDIHILAKELKVQSEQLEKCALLSQVDVVKDNVSIINEALRNTQIFVNDLSDDITQIQDILPTKATVAQVEECVKILDFEQYQQEMNSRLADKASLVITDTLGLQTRAIEQCLYDHQKRIDITIKFVEWFTNRGQMYEQNMKIIDRHLRDLVSSKQQPKVHTVYLPGGQLRFDPMEVMSDAENSKDMEELSEIRHYLDSQISITATNLPITTPIIDHVDDPNVVIRTTEEDVYPTF